MNAVAPDLLRETAVPAIPEVRTDNLVECVRAMRDVITVREGVAGDPLDQAITYREFFGMGKLDRSNINGKYYVRLPGVDAITYLDPARTITPEFNPPPAPTGVQANGALAVVILQWNKATYHGHAYTEIWRASVNVLGQAVRIGTTEASVTADELGLTGVTRYYWFRHVNNAGIAGPFNASAGTAATTGLVNTGDVTLGAITTTLLADGAVTTLKLGDASVTTQKVGDSQISTAKIGDLQVTTTKLGDSSITTIKIGDSQVTGIKIVDGAISTAKFASGIEPVSIVSALPNPVGYTGPKTVFLTSDSKLYRYTGSAWTLAVATVDLTGQITTAQVTDGAITAVKTALAAINAANGNLNSNTVDTAQLVASAVTASKTALAAISATTGNLNAGTVNTTQIVDSAVTAVKTALAAVDAATGNLNANTVNTTQIVAAAVTSLKLADASVIATKLGATFGGFNEARNSSFEVDTDADGLGDFWGLYNNGPEGATFSRQAGGYHGGFFQRVTWSVPNTTTKGIYGLTGNVAFKANKTYVISWYAKGSGGGVGTNMSLFWNTNPSSTVQLANPAVSASFQRYAFRITWGATVDPNFFISITNGGGQAAGSIDIDSVQVEEGEVLSAYTPKADEILPLTVTATELAPDSVTTPKIATDAVIAAKIAAGAITTVKIAAGAVTANEIAALTIVAGNIAAATITGAKIAATTITAGNIAALTITAAEIAASTITGAKIAANTIAAGNIVAGTITTAEIAANTILAANIAAATITGAKIAANTITAGNIVAGTITSNEIAALTILAGNISASAITVQKLLVVPESLCPDPIFNDSAWWSATQFDANGWEFSTEAGGMNAARVVRLLTGTVGTARKHIWSGPVSATGVGQTLRLRARGNNTANQAIFVAARFYDSADATISDLGTLTFAAGSGVTTQTLQGAVPNGAKSVRFIIYNDGGTAYTGPAYITEVKLDLAATAELIVDGSIITNKLAANAVTAAKIAAATITSNEIAALTILAGNIAALTITGDKIAANTITAAKIAADTITANEIAANAITSNELAANSVIAGKIAAAAVSTTELAAKAITTEKLSISVQTDNIVLNPSAEDGTSGWGLVEGGTSTLSADSGDKTEGAFSFKISGASEAGYGCRAIPLVPGDKYTIRVKTRGSAATASGLYVRMQEKAAYPSGDYVTSGGAGVRDSLTDFVANGAVTLGWTTHEFTYTVPASRFWGSMSILHWTGAPTDVYFDEVEVRKQLGSIQIETGAIIADKIGAAAVVAGKIAANAIVAADGVIANAAIATAQIIDAAITNAKIGALAVDTANIAALAVTTAKIAALAVTTAEIANAAITTAKIAALAVTAAEIANATITTAKIGNAQITTALIADAQITTAKIGALQVTSAEIANATITGGKIAASTITASNLSVTTLSAITADMGSITAGTITLNTAGGHIKSGMTAYLTGTGFWLGNDGGTAKFSIGDPANDYMSWNGSGMELVGSTKKYAAGTTILISANTNELILTGAYAKYKEIRVMNPGTLTVRITLEATLNSAPGTSTATGRIYVNDVAVGTERIVTRNTVGTTTTSFNENITVKRRDLIQLYAKFGGDEGRVLLLELQHTPPGADEVVLDS